MRYGVAESLQLLVCGFELCGALDDLLFQLLVQAADFLLGAVALGDVPQNGSKDGAPAFGDSGDAGFRRKQGAVRAASGDFASAAHHARRPGLPAKGADVFAMRRRDA